jgi:hypothetical protein
MKAKEKKRFNELYERHLNLMQLHGMTERTIEAYALCVRRVMMYFDCVPNKSVDFNRNPQMRFDQIYKVVL